jgi:hypothetical protein
MVNSLLYNYNNNIYDDQTPKPLTRQKRGAGKWIGETLSGCCNVLVKSDMVKMKQEADAITLYLETVKDNFDMQYQHLLDVHSDVKNIYAQYSETILTVRNDMLAIFDEVSQNTHNIESISEILHHYSKLIGRIGSKSLVIGYEVLMSQCHHNMLTESMVPKSELAKQIFKLVHKMNNVSDTRFQLLFPIDDIDSYYQHPLLNCFIAEDTVTIKVGIPFKYKEQDWKVQRLHVLPFQQGKNVVCSYTDLPSFIMIDNKNQQLRHIDPISYPSCTNMETRSLCFIPQYPKLFDKRTQCLKNLIFKPTENNLIDSCSYECQNMTSPVIYQLQPNRYIISNIDNVTLKCYDKTSDMPPLSSIHHLQDSGSLEVILNCECELTSFQGHTLIYPPFPCPSFIDNPEVTQIVPHTFLNSTDWQYRGDNIRISIQNLSTILKQRIYDLPTYRFESKIDQVKEQMNLLKLQAIPKIWDFQFETFNEWFFVLTGVMFLLICYQYYLVIWKLDCFRHRKIISFPPSSISNEGPMEPSAPIQQHPIVIRKRTPIPTPRTSLFGKKRPKYQISAHELQSMLHQGTSYEQQPPQYKTGIYPAITQ